MQIHVSDFIQPLAQLGTHWKEIPVRLKRQGGVEEDVPIFQNLQIWLPFAEGSAALETLHRCAEGPRSSLQHLLPSESLQSEQTLQARTKVERLYPPVKDRYSTTEDRVLGKLGRSGCCIMTFCCLEMAWY